MPGSQATTHYVPLNPSRHPSVHQSQDELARYNPAALPLRAEIEMLQQAQDVQDALTDVDASMSVE